MTPIVALDRLEEIAAGVDHADGICVAPDGSVDVTGELGQIDRVDDDRGRQDHAVYRSRHDAGLEVLAYDPEGTVLAAPTNVAFDGLRRDQILVPDIGRWHVTRFRATSLINEPLCYPPGT